ncbi:hypothetical protein [Draconibacterium sp.]|uniref:hypothetical protein n=1 Tax=Draconibacterium sp. TaxID=1965318 RepID=UPI003564FA20
MKKRYFLAADSGIEKDYAGVIVCMSTTDNGVPHTEETRILKYHNCTEEQRQKHFEKSLYDIAKYYHIKPIPDWILKMKKEGCSLPIQGEVSAGRRGSYVSRSTYQKLKEKEKRLMADIKALVNTDNVEQFCEVSQKWMKHFEKEEQFSKKLKTICGIYKEEHPEEFPQTKKD